MGPKQTRGSRRAGDSERDNTLAQVIMLKIATKYVYFGDNRAIILNTTVFVWKNVFSSTNANPVFVKHVPVTRVHLHNYQMPIAWIAFPCLLIGNRCVLAQVQTLKNKMDEALPHKSSLFLFYFLSDVADLISSLCPREKWIIAQAFYRKSNR